MTDPTNAELAAMFTEIGDLLEVRGDNPFKVRAYRRAADALQDMPETASTLDSHDLKTVPGIGEAIAAKILERVKTGHLDFLDRLQEDVPPSILELTKIPGIGPKTAATLLGVGVKSKADLFAANEDGRLVDIMGDKGAERLFSLAGGRKEEPA